MVCALLPIVSENARNSAITAISSATLLLRLLVSIVVAAAFAVAVLVVLDLVLDLVLNRVNAVTHDRSLRDSPE